MNRLARVVLRTYPPSFRERYGAELAALTDELPDSARTTCDLALGAARAWIAPSFSGEEGRRLRLQASVATTWLAWCAGFLIVPAMNKALLDPPAAGNSALVRGLLYAASAILLVGWVLALTGASQIVVRALVPGLRSRPREFIGPMVPVMVSGTVVVLGLGAFVATGHLAFFKSAETWVFIVWLCVLAGFLVCLGIAPGVVLRRLDIRAPTLRFAVRLAPGIALALATMCACSLAAVVVGGDAELFSSSVPVVISLVIACLAALVALISSTRGIRAAAHMC